MWWNQRRPEIVEDFDREIYGRLPTGLPKVTWEVIKSTEVMNGDVPVITKQLAGHVDNSSYPQITVDIQVTLTTPANAKGPVPVFWSSDSPVCAEPRGRPLPVLPGNSKFWRKVGAMPSFPPPAFRPITDRA
jgi:hypothetical protein